MSLDLLRSIARFQIRRDMMQYLIAVHHNLIWKTGVTVEEPKHYFISADWQNSRYRVPLEIIKKAGGDSIAFVTDGDCLHIRKAGQEQ